MTTRVPFAKMMITEVMIIVMMIISIMIMVFPSLRPRGRWHRQSGDQCRQTNASHFGEMAPSKPCFRELNLQLLH
jgi:hypothetical protein